MKLGYWFAAMFLFSVPAHAEIYKSVDADGHVTYSSTPIKGGKKIILEPLPTMVPPPARTSSTSTASPEGFPKVDGATQKGRDDERRKLLQDELSREEKLLEEARQKLKDGEDNPEVYRGQDGKIYRNMAKYEEKVKALNYQVEQHQKNVELLKASLSNLK